MDALEYDALIPLEQHGFRTGGRREGACLTQRAVGWRLKRKGVAHINDLLDMTNAFLCARRDRMNEEGALLFASDPLKVLLMEERLANGIIH